MEVRYFKLVIAIAETGSVTRAASRLFLSQSALSHQLREVEEQLGCPLFTRVKKKLVLTQAGKTFLDGAYRVLDELHKLKSQISRQTTGEVGTIRLTTESSTCYHWLPSILRKYQEEFPNIDIRLNTHSPSRPLDLLLAGKVDLAIVHRKRQEKNIVFEPLFTDEVVALVSSHDVLSKRKHLVAEDFNEVTYITHSRRFQESAFFEEFLIPNHISPRKVIYIPLTEAVVAMVKEGMGIAVLAKWLVTPYLGDEKIRVLKITGSGLKRNWYIAGLKKDSTPKYVNYFIELVKSIKGSPVDQVN